MRMQWARIIEVGRVIGSVQELSCETVEAEGTGRVLKALHYLDFGLPVASGQMVMLNVTAIDLGLGTGGVAFVVPAQSFADYRGDGGHIVKLRYTPLQRELLSVEEQASPYHDLLSDASSLDGLPVVCCLLHSQMPLVAAAIKYLDATARVVYCMTDQGALMMSFSDVVRACKGSGLIDATISCGQAMGGDMEAVNLYSGLLAARLVLQADYAIVAIGPGVVGTATAFGHGGLAQADALNAAYALGGCPVACLRISEADPRPRHRGLSHHSTSALGRACLAPCYVALPTDLEPEVLDELREGIHSSGIGLRHQVVRDQSHLSEIDLRGIKPSSMGRGLADDPAFFKAASCAGIVAAGLKARERGQASMVETGDQSGSSNKPKNWLDE